MMPDSHYHLMSFQNQCEAPQTLTRSNVLYVLTEILFFLDDCILVLLFFNLGFENCILEDFILFA